MTIYREFVYQLRVRTRTSCGECDYFEDDRALKHQCLACVWSDTVTAYLRAINIETLRDEQRKKRVRIGFVK